jgi:adenosylcobinamide amidohydrolase
MPVNRIGFQIAPEDRILMASFSPLRISLDTPWLLVRFDRPHVLLSWSLNRPGYVVADKVAWLQVGNHDLPCDLDPKLFLEDRLREHDKSDAVAFMTSRDVSSWQETNISHQGVRCRGVMTLDLGNGSHVGFPPEQAVSSGPGTINLLCQLSEPLNQAAMLEAISILTQGRTAALSELACRPRAASRAVTGTGTDCIVLACPIAESGFEYAGLHTAIGQALGQCAYQLTEKAARGWQQENGL